MCEQVKEVGDGNINFVYIVEGPQGALVLKQGLPYIRIAPDWPLTQVWQLLHAATGRAGHICSGYIASSGYILLILCKHACAHGLALHATHALPLSQATPLLLCMGCIMLAMP